MESLRESGADGFVDQRWDQTVEIFSSCPTSLGIAPKSYLKRAREVARWSERHGFRGVLVHADTRLVDPWMVSQVIVQSTRALGPLVAVQPAYMHPFTVANMIATLATLYGRRSFIHWVTSPSADDTPHEERYDRLVEFASIVRQLTDGETVSVEGRYYAARSLKLRQPVDPAIRPEFLVSGSSPAGRGASQTLGARSVTYPLPPDEEQLPPLDPGLGAVLRLGIIARADEGEAWRAAYERFPLDRKTAPARHASRGLAGSPDEVARLVEERVGAGTPYWTQPFESYQAMCPYLVGSHEDISAVISRYVQRGFGTFILDEPDTEADLENARIVFEDARRNIMEAA
jgi:alkanesulfonate monooxygenase